MEPGQAGIALRRAWLAGDVAGVIAAAAWLDGPHRVELLLGAALRDARGGFALARRYLQLPAWIFGGEWEGWVAEAVEGEPDTTRDDHLAARVAARRLPDRWVPARDLPRLLQRPDHPLFPAVHHYYTVGTLHALGVRPLYLVLEGE